MTSALILSALFIFTNSAEAIKSDRKLYNQIRSYSYRGNTWKVRKYSLQFFRKYPRSRLIPDVRLLKAENEINITKALKTITNTKRQLPLL